MLKVCATLLLTGVLCVRPVGAQDQGRRLTNQDVIDMAQLGLSDDVIVAKVEAAWRDRSAAFDTTVEGLKALKGARVSDSVIKAMIGSSPVLPGRKVDELTAMFQEYQKSVVTVWSEIGHGTGFVVDAKGLVVPNQHVIGPSELISVKFDEKRKVAAARLAVDPEKDVAILWVDLSAFPEAVVAPIAKPGNGQDTVVEGERVFTIGSPLSQRKILTSGIVSKVEPASIISDININPGNSGGPLFNSLGQVVGI